MNKESLKTKLAQLLTQNVGLKILSLVVAIVLWLIVINITDPVISNPYRNVPVRLLNKDTITSAGKTIEVLEGTDVVGNVVVRAPRSVIRELGDLNDCLIATADVNSLSYDETSIPIHITTTKYSDKVESIKGSIDKMEVSIEPRKTLQLPIKATTSGDIESGYVIGNISQSQNQVRVSGPQSKVSQIASAYVDVQVTGFKENISTSAEISLYDIDGNELSLDPFEMNIDSVKVDVEILETKKIPIVLESIGTPAEGYDTTGEVECDVDSIVIAGTTSLINRVDSLKIPASALNVNGLTSSLKAVLDVTDYLPSGVRLADSSANLINVTVYIEKIQEKSFSVFLRSIVVDEIPDGFSGVEWAQQQDYVEFTLMGLPQNLENIQLSQLNFSVNFSDYALMNDISGFRAGVYELPLLLDLPDGVWMKEPVEIAVKLLK